MSKSILQDCSKENCYLCELLYGDMFKRAAQEHHIFGAANRGKSEKYGLKVRLCYEHHGAKGDKDVHRPDKNDYGKLLKQIAQKKFEAKYDHETFMREFGQNYL